MEDWPASNSMDEQIELPPGFRFHPTDEELITHYLSLKVADHSFSAIAIAQVDLNKVEPWDLPWKAKMGGKEWYFFWLKDRKYPTGSRTNRATDAGYWKATGKDKEIFREKSLVGMKKTLVFYRGRAPKGEKTNWVMHEYRMEGNNLKSFSKNEWAICRIFNKGSSSQEKKKMEISADYSSDSRSPEFPSLTESTSGETHVPCFSNPMGNTGIQNRDEFNSGCFNFLHPENSVFSPQFNLHDSVPKLEFSEYNQNLDMAGFKPFGMQDFILQDMSTCPFDMDSLWNY